MSLKGIKKYYAGLAALGVFTLAILIFVLLMAGITKQDTNTYNKASKIADKLNNYVDTNQTIPDSLSRAGINDVPSTITYTKKSDSSYTFCMTYRQDSTDFYPYNSGSDTGSYTGGDVLNPAINLPLEPSTGYDYSDNSELYINPNYHKGQNCQTVQPYISTSIYNDYNYNGGAVTQ